MNTETKEILLGLKKRGFGSGKLIGIGGKVEEGETIALAAVREASEEIGVLIAQDNLSNRGVIHFKFPSKPSWDQDVHLFSVTTWKGAPVESEEIRPSWFSFDHIPYQKMWDDARYWLPKLLVGEVVKATIAFADDLETVKDIAWDVAVGSSQK